MVGPVTVGGLGSVEVLRRGLFGEVGERSITSTSEGLRAGGSVASSMMKKIS